MPHEVIMPALGMAQDSGLIVSWLKQPGEPVKAGEALLEVETDKATMEVEAQADGFLTNVTAQAGDNVPVGNTVAHISETADTDSPPNPTRSAAEDEAEPAADAPMEGTDVIMPALGMAQETGLIVAWHKKPGDPVNTEDVLLEVETDKATMEVAAEKAGYLAAIYAGEGDSVPVGDVIALISAAKPEGAMTSPVRKQPTPEPKRPEHPKEQPHRKNDIEQFATVGAGDISEARILASPKAKRLAKERGLDLASLVAAGASQPLHVKDLDDFKAHTKPNHEHHHLQVPQPAQRLVAEFPEAPLVDFHHWLASELGHPVAKHRLLAFFAAAALRQVRSEAGLTILIESRGSQSHTYIDPDLAGLGHADATSSEDPPDLVLRDLTDTALVTVHLEVEDTPTLCLMRKEGTLTLTLECNATQLSAADALSLMRGLAERLTTPLRHLL